MKPYLWIRIIKILQEATSEYTLGDIARLTGQGGYAEVRATLESLHGLGLVSKTRVLGTDAFRWRWTQ